MNANKNNYDVLETHVTSFDMNENYNLTHVCTRNFPMCMRWQRYVYIVCYD